MSVTVEQYNPEWPSKFLAIKAKLDEYLSDVEIEAIEHVGSTSVPGMAAKPIIDIDIIVTRDNVQLAANALSEKGNFAYMGELGIQDRHVVRDPDQDPERNIYICVENAFSLRNHLAVRDVLRTNPALREEYAALKLELAAQDTNINDYIGAKSEVIGKILRLSDTVTEAEIVAIAGANFRGERISPIKTERLKIREFTTPDLNEYHRLESHPDVVRFQTWEPKTQKQARDDFRKILEDSVKSPRSVWELAVEHEGTFIGRIGARVKRENEDGVGLDPPHADLWFSFFPDVQGNGFATEAMHAFIPGLGSPLELEIECDPRNTGSWKLAERLGFTKISLTEKAFECKGEWVDSLVYRKYL